MSKLEDKMRLPDRGASKGKNSLSILFSRVMSKIRLSPNKIEENNRIFVKNPVNQVPDDSGKRSSAAGNIRKEIERDTMTWRVFEKLIRWSRPKSAKVYVVIDWKDGKQTIDQVNIRIDDYVFDEDPDERQLSELSNDDLIEEMIARAIPGITYVIPGLVEKEKED